MKTYYSSLEIIPEMELSGIGGGVNINGSKLFIWLISLIAPDGIL